MSKNDKNIDELFKQAARNVEAPAYKDEYWKEMSAMLLQRKRNQRKLIYWSIAGILVFLTGISSLFLLSNSNQHIEKSQYAYERNHPVDLTPVSPKKTDEINEISTEFLIPNHAEEIEVSIVSTDQAKEESFSNEVANLPPTNKNTTDAQTSTSKKQPIAFSKNNKNNTVEKQTVFMEENKVESTVEREKQTANKRDLLSIPSLSPLSIPFSAPRFTSISPIEETTSLFRYNFYVEVAGGIMENYKTGRPLESGMFTVSTQFEMQFKQLKFHIGLGSQVATNTDLIMSKRTQVGDFNILEIQDDLIYKTLVQLYIPIEFGYQFRTTSFGIGLQGNYLFNPRAEHQTFVDDEWVATEQLKSSSQGLNKISAQGYVWIEHQFTPVIGVGAKLGTHLSSQIDNSIYFTNSVSTNPIYGQVFLRFRLIK